MPSIVNDRTKSKVPVHPGEILRDMFMAPLGLSATALAKALGVSAPTVNDIVRHLHDGDLMAAASVAGPEHFAKFRAERQALLDQGLTRVRAANHRLGDLAGARLLERWHGQVADLCEKLSALPPDTRLKWAAPTWVSAC